MASPMSDLTGPRRLPGADTATDSLVVLLHGIGASGDDLIGLADYWAGTLPNTAFYSPHAPHPYDDAPMGYQWYSRHTEQSRIDGVYEVEGPLNAYVDDLLGQHGLDPSRCALVGFSQGAIVGLHVALRRRVAVGGLVAFSGLIGTSDRLKGELASKLPVCLVHGADDPVLPAEGSEAAGRLLTDLGVPNEVHILPGLGHAIDQRGLEHATRFLLKVLG